MFTTSLPMPAIHSFVAMAQCVCLDAGKSKKQSLI